jgi:hypothetical protein
MKYTVPNYNDFTAEQGTKNALQDAQKGAESALPPAPKCVESAEKHFLSMLSNLWDLRFLPGEYPRDY